MSKPSVSRGWACSLGIVPVLVIAAVACCVLGSAKVGSTGHGSTKLGHAATSAAIENSAPQPKTVADAKNRIKANITANYAALPLAFEQNQGQTDSRVKYMARGDGYTLFLTANDAVFALRSNQSHRGSGPMLRGRARVNVNRSGNFAEEESPAVVRMQLAGANSAPYVSASDLMPGKSNYFLGDDPSQWHANVPHYARVSYREVYPGVNLAFHGAQRQTEFDFVVAAEASAAPIALRFSGARALKTNKSGNLIISSAAGDVQLHKPVAYQEQNGARHPIDASFVLQAGNQVAFALGSYDHSRELIIDPSVSYSYSTYLGGSGDDEGYGIAFDGSGNAYVTGETTSSNFPGAGAYLGNGDVFVTEISADGSSLVYSTYLGGSNLDAGYAIAVDGSGNAYVTGLTQSSSLPMTTGAYQATLKSASGNAFVCEVKSGGTVGYCTYLGGSVNSAGTASIDAGFGIAVASDGSGDVYVVGKTTSTSFPTVSPLQAYITNSVSSGFVTKVNSTGTGLVYSTYLGGSTTTGDFDAANAVAVDSSDNAYVTGETFSPTYHTTSNAFQTTCGSCSNGNSNGFVTVINPSGSGYVYSTYLGGSATDSGNGIAVDSSGNAYVTGATTSADFPHTSGSIGGSTDAFVTKLNATGTAPLTYSIFVGGTGLDAAAGIALDGSGNAYITGATSSTTGFPIVNAVQPTYGGGQTDAFVTEVGPTGSVVFSTYLGGNGQDDVQSLGAIAVDSAGANIYVTGNTVATPGVANNFPTQAAYQLTPGGGIDAFVVKYTQGTTQTFSLSATALSPATVSPGGSATSTVTVVPAGGFSGSVTLACSVSGPSGAVLLPTCSGSTSTSTPGTLTVSTTAATALLQEPTGRHSNGMFYAMLLPIGGMALVGFGSRGDRRKKMFSLTLLGLLLCGFMFMPACGGSSSKSGGGGTPGTTAGSYTITVTGTATGATQTGTSPALTLTVN